MPKISKIAVKEVITEDRSISDLTQDNVFIISKNVSKSMKDKFDVEWIPSMIIASRQFLIDGTNDTEWKIKNWRGNQNNEERSAEVKFKTDLDLLRVRINFDFIGEDIKLKRIIIYNKNDQDEVSRNHY